MATLPDADRRELWAQWMREASARREQITLSKTELRAAVDAIDAWIDANGASFNSAIPQPARGALSARQKAELFFFIVRRRFEVT